MQKNNQSIIIDLLRKNEEKISKLYKIYAEKFKDWNNFWSALASEEIEHADWLKILYSKVKDNSLYFNEGRFNRQAIITFSDYLEKQLKNARNEDKDISVKYALGIALDIENALIERKYFEVFESDAAEMKRTLLNLKSAEEKHIAKISDALNKIDR